MNTLKTVIDQANDLLAEHAAVLDFFDPEARPLRALDRDEETTIMNGEKRAESGIQRLLDGLEVAKSALANPDYSDEVKADIYMKLNVMLNGVPDA